MKNILFIITLLSFSIAGHCGEKTQLIQAYRQWRKADNELRDIQKPIVTIFGSGKMDDENPFYKQAHTLAKQLASQGFVIVTGGNQGIMKAANCGAREVTDQGITSISINIEGLNVANICAQKTLLINEFSLRKKLMMDYASAFVIFPGGIGTLDELSELVTLMATHHLPRKPIYVIGKDYWNYLQKWFEKGIEEGFITQEAFDLFTFTDDSSEVEKGINAS